MKIPGNSSLSVKNNQRPPYLTRENVPGLNIDMRPLDNVIKALSNINKYLLIGILAFISIVMHWPHFSKDLVSLHVWRQVETQTTILNFYEEDFNLLNPRQNNRGDGDGIFRMEFPLMQWLVAGIFRLLGNHIIITRIFMFLTGLVAIFGIYALVFQLFNRKFPALVAALALNFSPAFYYYTINPLPDNFALSCSVWGLALMAYYLFEINAIGKVHDYYLFPFYPALIILAGYGAEQLVHSKRTWLKYLSLVLILSAPFTCYARMYARWDVESPGFNVNLLRYRQELREAVPGNALCIAGNDESYRIFLYYIDKKGWSFTRDRMDKTRIEGMIGRGVRFLFSDSRKVDKDPEIILPLDQLVLEKGNIRIFGLRAGSDGKMNYP